MSKVAPKKVQSQEEILWDQTVRLLSHGIEPQRISTELVQQKWSAEAAGEFVEQARKYVEEFKSSPEGKAERRRRMLVEMQVGILWLGGGILLAMLMQFWPRSEMLPFIAGFALIYGLYEIYASRKRHAS